MIQTVAATTGTHVSTAVRGTVTHTVGVELLTAAQLQAAGYVTFNPARAAVHRYPDGRIAQIITADVDLCIARDVDAVVKAYADWHGYTVVAPIPTVCGWCGKTECPDPFGHGRLGAVREARLLESGDVDSTLVMRWAA